MGLGGLVITIPTLNGLGSPQLVPPDSPLRQSVTSYPSAPRFYTCNPTASVITNEINKRVDTVFTRTMWEKKKKKKTYVLVNQGIDHSKGKD